MTLRQQHQREHLRISHNGSDYSLIADQAHVVALRELFRQAHLQVREEEVAFSGVLEICFRIREEQLEAAEAVLATYQRAE